MSSARVAYERDVYPIHTNKCGGCHAVIEDPTFVDLLDAGDSYTDTKSFPSILGSFNEAAPIVTHHDFAGWSTTMWYTGAEKQLVIDWLALELLGP